MPWPTSRVPPTVVTELLVGFMIGAVLVGKAILVLIIVGALS